MGKRIRKRVLELISELPQVGIEKGHHRESGRPNPYVEEAIRTGMRHSWVSSVCISKVLLHRLRRLASPRLLSSIVLLCSKPELPIASFTMLIRETRMAYPGTGSYRFESPMDFNNGLSRRSRPISFGNLYIRASENT